MRIQELIVVFGCLDVWIAHRQLKSEDETTSGLPSRLKSIQNILKKLYFLFFIIKTPGTHPHTHTHTRHTAIITPHTTHATQHTLKVLNI